VTVRLLAFAYSPDTQLFDEQKRSKLRRLPALLWNKGQPTFCSFADLQAYRLSKPIAAYIPAAIKTLASASPKLLLITNKKSHIGLQIIDLR